MNLTFPQKKNKKKDGKSKQTNNSKFWKYKCNARMLVH